MLKKSLFVLICLCLFQVLYACVLKDSEGPVDFAHQVSDLPPDENVIYGKLENGVRYAFLENDTPTKTAALRVRFSTGSLNEKDDERGLAHFLEHMAFNGSKNIPEGEMIKRLERFGLAFGADTNAYTSFDETVYILDLPEVSEEILNETFMIMRETAENLTLTQDAIDRERGVIQAEKRRLDSPGVRASLAQMAFFTRGSRIADRLPIGTNETLALMNAEVFMGYYRGYYRPENTFIVLVGDINKELAIAKIKAYFSDWQGVGEMRGQNDAGITSARTSDIGYFSEPGIQTSVTLARIRPFVDQPDTVKTRKQRFIEGLGIRILNRRFAKLAREADAVFISGSAGYGFALESAEIPSLVITSRPQNWKKALAVAEQELRKAMQFGFTGAELKEQIANSRKSLQVSVQIAETRRTPALASGLLSSFGNETVFTHPESDLERFATYADTITTDQVWKVFKAKWKGFDKPLIFLQTREVLAAPEADIRDAFESSLSTAVSANAVITEDKFAYTDFGKPGKVTKEIHVEDIDAYQIRFANNVRLNFKQTDFEKEQINVVVSVGDGSLSIPRKDMALQYLAANLMAAGGLEAHSADDLQRLLAGKAVGVHFGFLPKYFTLSGVTVSADLSDQFNLMTAQLIAPGYRNEAKARHDKYIESWYPTLTSTPEGVARRDVGLLIHSGDERYGIPDQETLTAVKIDEVKNWLGQYLQSGSIEVAVVGDINKDRVIAEVARTFAALPNRKETTAQYPDMQKVRFPVATTKPVTLHHSGDANRALLQVYWPAPDGTDIMVTRQLNVLRSLFNNRLTDVIREEEAVAYSPSTVRAGSRNFPGYGYMSALLGLEPGQVDNMTAKLDEIAADLQAGNISGDEFDRAIEPILETLDTNLENNGYWLRVIGEMQSDRWELDNHRTREEAYRNMTVSDLKPLAAKIFDTKKAYRIRILPKN